MTLLGVNHSCPVWPCYHAHVIHLCFMGLFDTQRDKFRSRQQWVEKINSGQASTVLFLSFRKQSRNASLIESWSPGTEASKGTSVTNIMSVCFFCVCAFKFKQKPDNRQQKITKGLFPLYQITRIVFSPVNHWHSNKCVFLFFFPLICTNKK